MTKVLVSDLDGTLLGDDSLELFVEWWEENKEEFSLIYATGRSVESVLDLVSNTSVPKPEVIIAEMGTVIWWSNLRRECKLWPPVYAAWDRGEICSLLSIYKELVLQPEEYQSEHKLSYFADDFDNNFLMELNWKITQKGYMANLIYSYNQYLDILPAGLDKGAAVDFVIRQMEFVDQVIVAGDSGNDRSMFGRGYNGILVANAETEMNNLTTSPFVYHSKLSYAAGVVDGLNYWTNRRKNVTTNR